MNEKGATLLDLIIGFSLFSIILGYTATSYFSTSTLMRNHTLRQLAEERAIALADLLTTDLRKAGTGIPLGQDDFPPGGSGLGDAPLAVLLTSDSDTVVFRLSESVAPALVTAAFTPSGSNPVVTLDDVSDFAEDDVIYISDSTTGGVDGFKGTVDSVSGNTVTFESGYVNNAGASFPIGSIATRVATYTYNSPTDWSGVTLTTASSTYTIAPNSTFAVTYLDCSGTTFSTPLTNADLLSNLCAIEVTASVRADARYKDGTLHTAGVTRRVALRNLIMNRSL